MKTTTSPLRLLPYLGLTLLLEEATAQDPSSSSSVSLDTSSYIYVPTTSSDQAAAAAAATSSTTPPPPPPPPPPASTTSTSPDPDVATSVVYTTVTSYVVAGGAANPPSSTTSSAYDGVSADAASVSLTTTVTVDSYLPSTSTSTTLRHHQHHLVYPAFFLALDLGDNMDIDLGRPTLKPRPRRSPALDDDRLRPALLDRRVRVSAPRLPPTAAQPTWATGSFYTQLASALYAVDKSFAGRSDYATIVAAISHAGDADSPQVSASIASSAWGWAAVTTNGWFQSDVPAPVQTDVARYVDAWHDAEFSVLSDAQKAEATETGKSGGGGRGRGRIWVRRKGGGGGGDGGGGASSSGGCPSIWQGWVEGDGWGRGGLVGGGDRAVVMMV
ncbi:hypothetical protein PG988_015955 [Apiospora saccharicola]